MVPGSQDLQILLKIKAHHLVGPNAVHLVPLSPVRRFQFVPLGFAPPPTHLLLCRAHQPYGLLGLQKIFSTGLRPPCSSCSVLHLLFRGLPDHIISDFHTLCSSKIRIWSDLLSPMWARQRWEMRFLVNKQVEVLALLLAIVVSHGLTFSRNRFRGWLK